MSRPFTDIAAIDAELPIKNGSVTITSTTSGKYQTLNTYTKNIPTIENIQAKYGYRFYNGIFVSLVDDQTVIGG